MLETVELELDALSELRDTPAGSIRITADEHAVARILVPALAGVLADYPDISVEVVVDYGLTDIVAERYDAGVRLGETLAKDMVAIPISPEMQSVVVATPTYFTRNKRPRKPQDLTEHLCINLRLPTHGGLYPWEFEKDGHEVRVRVDGQLVFNSINPIYQAALEGLGLAYLPLDMVDNDIAAGRLIQVLKDWTPPYPGYHLYYPSRRHPTHAFSVLIDALRKKQASRRPG